MLIVSLVTSSCLDNYCQISHLNMFGCLLSGKSPQHILMVIVRFVTFTCLDVYCQISHLNMFNSQVSDLKQPLPCLAHTGQPQCGSQEKLGQKVSAEQSIDFGHLEQ